MICKCYAEPKVKRSSHSQSCMSIDEPMLINKRKKEKHHSQPKKKRSTHSQTSMSVDESRSENRTSRGKKQKVYKRRKTKERSKVKSKRSARVECSCTSIRKRKDQKKSHTKKKKKMNRTSNTDFFRCKCSDTSLSSSKSTRKHFTKEQYFDNRISNKDRTSNSLSSELECQFCESCLSSLELKMNLHQKNKSSTEVTCKCFSSSEFSSSMSQTDTSRGMLIDQKIQGNRKKHPKFDVEKKNQESTATMDGMMIDQKNKHQENNKKQTDNTSVTCVCLYPGSDESPVKNTTHDSNKPLNPLDKNISNHSNKPLNLLDKIAQLRYNKSCKTGPIYKADADFCECFSNLIQPPTKDKTFKEIERDLKRSEKASSSKRKDKERSIVSCKCPETLNLVNIGTQENELVQKKENSMDMEYKENMNFVPTVDFNSTQAVLSSEMAKQLCGTFAELCYCETPKTNPSDVVYSAYFSHSSIVDSNNLFHNDKTAPLHYRASCILDTTKHTPSIPKSNSV